MRRFLSVLAIAVAGVALSACGERVKVNPGEVAKQIDQGGLDDEILGPGAYRLDACLFGACPGLARLQVAKAAEEVTVGTVFLPKSNVDLSNVSFGIQFQIKREDKWINAAFNEIRSVPATDSGSSRQRIITSEMIFETYIQRKAPQAVIAALRQYTVEQVLSEVDVIAEFVQKKVNEDLTGTPVRVTEFGFPNGIGSPPKVVLDQKRQLYAVAEQKERRIKQLEADLEIEQYRQAVQRVRVKNDRANAEKAGVPFDTYVFLKNMERFADAAAEGTPVYLGVGGSGFVPGGK
jgi:hypothetical protein